jgi:transposase-like protein
MRLGIRAELAGLSLSNTVRLLAFLVVAPCRTTVHNWVQKAGLEPSGGCAPEQMALEETVIKVNGERFWIYAPVDTATNRFCTLGCSQHDILRSPKDFCASLIRNTRST